MTPKEASFYRNFGFFLLANLITVIMITFFYAISLTVFFFAVRQLWKRNLRNRPALIMSCACFAGIGLFTIYVVAITSFTIADINNMLLHTRSGLLRPTTPTNNKLSFTCVMLITWATLLLTWISDSIVVWRAWALYSNKRWMMLGPCLLLLGTISSGLALCVIQINQSFLKSRVGITVAKRLFDTTLAFSLATNAVTTLLTLYRLWTHRKFFHNVGRRPTQRSQVEKVMIALIESGFVYCGIQMLYMIVQYLPKTILSPADISTTVMFAISIAFTATYPSLVVVFVSQKRSMVETFGFTSMMRKYDLEKEDHEATVGHLSFSSPGTFDVYTIGQTDKSGPLIIQGRAQ